MTLSVNPCVICKIERNPDNFYWVKGKKKSYCKKCVSIQKKQYRLTNKEYAEKANNTARLYKQNNKYKVTLKIKEYMNSENGRARRCAIQMKRKAAQLKRTPRWANLDKINEFYLSATKTSKVVDHIVPLQGKLVSGLHVENNLQLLTRHENSKKLNQFNSDWEPKHIDFIG
jgi:hypothetical protein